MLQVQGYVKLVSRMSASCHKQTRSKVKLSIHRQDLGKFHVPSEVSVRREPGLTQQGRGWCAPCSYLR